MNYDQVSPAIHQTLRRIMTQSLKLLKAKPYPLGMYIKGQDLIFSGTFINETGCGIILYPCTDGVIDTAKPQIVPLTDQYRHGSLYSVRIVGGALAFGAYQLMSGGNRYADPLSTRIQGLEEFGVYKKEDEIFSIISDDDYDWGNDKRPHTAFDKSFIYLVNVRGYTMLDTGVPVRHRGTFLGLVRKIEYLKSLGVTAIELMPVYEQPSVLSRRSLELMHAPVHRDMTKDRAMVSEAGFLKEASDSDRLVNLWGFEPGFPYAVRSAYAVKGNDPSEEFKDMVREFHRAGIEVIVQTYFAEGLTHQNMQEILRYWVSEYHIDGVHIKGKDVSSTMLSQDPLLSDIKIFDYGFDYWHLYGGVSREPSKRNLASYKDDFEFTARHFLKGDDNIIQSFLNLSQETGTAGGAVHYICNYDGARLADLVTYDHKYNEANGENNTDGIDDNVSWNCGVEGRSRRKDIMLLRARQIKNALVMLFLSQGTPMLFGGDEFCNSQAGNNNPYCQDNNIGWIEWKNFAKHKDLVDFTRFLTGLRNKYEVFRSAVPYRLMDYKAVGYPDFSYHGTQAWRPDLSAYSHTIGMLYCGLYCGKGQEHSFVYVAYNMHWEDKEFSLPELPKGCEWQLLCDTADSEADYSTPKRGRTLKDQSKATLLSRSVSIFISKGEPERTGRNISYATNAANKRSADAPSRDK